jgi:hypothetical protein
MSNFIKLSPSWEANSCFAREEILPYFMKLDSLLRSQLDSPGPDKYSPYPHSLLNWISEYSFHL